MTWPTLKGGHRCHAAVSGQPRQPRAGRATSDNYDTIRRASLARHMLIVWFIPMLGCIPPTLELEQPVEPNSPPVTLSVRGPTGDELPWPGPVTLVRGTGTATLVVRDLDLADSLYVQFFVDYGMPDPQPTRTPSCRVGPVIGGDSPDRTISCDIRGVCLPGDVGISRTLLVDAYDREPQLGTDSDLFRTVTEPGYRYEKVYDLLCVDGATGAAVSADATPMGEVLR